MARSVFSASWHNVSELRPRLLPHARFHRHRYRGELWHVVHDTTSGRYHRLSPGAYDLARRMDGRETVQALWDRACRAGDRDLPTQNEMVELLSQLHAHDLLHCDVTPDAARVFERFRKLGGARQVLHSLTIDGVHFPRPSDGKKLVSFDWTPIRYRNVISVLKKPFYAGAYVYGKSEKRTTLVEGRLRKSYGHGKPFDQWEVML